MFPAITALLLNMLFPAMLALALLQAAMAN